MVDFPGGYIYISTPNDNNNHINNHQFNITLIL